MTRKSDRGLVVVSVSFEFQVDQEAERDYQQESIGRVRLLVLGETNY
jgi:hypothetical protein